MKIFQGMMMAALLGASALQAEVPELLELVPEAKGYELIGQLDPTKWNSEGYRVDRGEELSGELKRIGYLLKLTGKDGKMSWVFTAMDAFTQIPAAAGIPTPASPVFQMYVDNLEVAGNAEGLKTGKFAKGNIEIWGTNYGPANAKNIPGATDRFDFGDTQVNQDAYGSFQVHNYLEKQTVLAFNNFNAGGNCDLGIGNNPSPDAKANPDWTFSASARNCKSAELFIVGKFDNLKILDVVKLDPAKVQLTASADRNPLSYKPGEPMTFTLQADFGGKKPSADYFIKWERTGDDGRKTSGKEKVTDQPVKITTSLDRPGFVRIYATLVDRNGRNVIRKNSGPVAFDGGAGVEPEKLAGVPEPDDFDAFWQKQKAKLAAIPLKAKMDQVKSSGTADIYAVSVDCAGPRPVTGYLTIPLGAKEKSLPAQVNYQGYGTAIQRAPGDGPADRINFTINAHGYDLGRDDAYYKNFIEKTKSNGKGYAFDPKQNADPESAYFNGMALRVLRSLEFVKSLPQWDGKTLTASGGSQGGLQTVWAAGLDPDVTMALPNIPWCSDLGGVTLGRNIGNWRIAYTRALDYYDTINHAKRIKCQVEIPRAGLGDYVCPPSGVAILYNNIKSPKKITYVQGSTHGYVPPNAQQFSVESK